MYFDDFPKGQRVAILAEQQGWRCCYCGVRFGTVKPSDIRYFQDTRPTIEHVIRLADGGQKTWDNEVAACGSCNSCRGDTDAWTFSETVRERGLNGIRAVWRTRRQGKLSYPPNLGEVPMTSGRMGYFQAVYGPWKKAPVAIELRDGGPILSMQKVWAKSTF